MKLRKRKSERRSIKAFPTVVAVSRGQALLRGSSESPITGGFKGALVTSGPGEGCWALHRFLSGPSPTSAGLGLTACTPTPFLCCGNEHLTQVPPQRPHFLLEPFLPL